MQRHNSKNSITSIGSSSRIGEKKPSPTHMIIQRENDHQMILLPTTHLVNSSVTRIRLNDTATFKLDFNNRKQERGRILQLGNKEECAEQLQIFEMTADIDIYEKTNDIDDDENDENEEEQKKEKQNKSREKSSTTPLHNPAHTIGRLNQNTSLSSSKKQTTDVPKQKDILKSKYSQIDEEPEQSSNDSDAYSKIISSKETFNDNMLSEHHFERSTSISMGKQQTHTSLKNKNKNRFVSQSQITVGDQSKHTDKYDDNDTTTCRTTSSDEEELPELNFNDSNIMARYEELNKKYKKIQAKNISLERENERLFKENQMLKKNTIPIPDPACRQWIIDTGKRLDVKCSSDIHTHAKALNIDNVRDLVECIDGTTTSTARQLVKLLYPLSVRQIEKGNIVSKEQRQLIRAFAESQHGPVSDHNFHEAIDGVFRSAKKKLKDDQQHQSELTLSNNQNKSNQCINKGQKTITQMMKTKTHVKLNSNGMALGKENKHNEEVHQQNK